MCLYGVWEVVYGGEGGVCVFVVCVLGGVWWGVCVLFGLSTHLMMNALVMSCLGGQCFNK